MEQSSENKAELKDKFSKFYIRHKIKLYILLTIFFISSFLNVVRRELQ